MSENKGYAHPEALVDAEWVQAHLNDPNVRLLEVDVDTKAYDEGHIPGAVGFNWQTQLQDQLVRAPVGKEQLEELLSNEGMSVAALEAKMLDVCLRDQQRRGTRNDLAGFPQRFQQAIVEVVKVPWMLATGEDFRYPETEGKRPFGMSLLHWYSRRVNELTASNPLVAGRFYEVLHLLKPPTVLFDPRIAWAVLKQELASRRQKPGASLPADEASSPVPNHTLVH